MADYYSTLASDKPIRVILGCAKSSKLSAAFGLRSNFKLIVSLRGKELEIMFILKMFFEHQLKYVPLLILLIFMSWNLHNLLKMNDS